MACPQATVISSAVANTGMAAGLTWMILDLVMVFPQTTAVQVSVTSPPQTPGMVLKEEVAVPESLQFPVKPLS